MDLGLKGKKALVCAASKGLGRGCAEALAEEGVNLVIASRTKEDIEAQVSHIAQVISADYKDRELILIGILKGAFIFQFGGIAQRSSFIIRVAEILVGDTYRIIFDLTIRSGAVCTQASIRAEAQARA